MPINLNINPLSPIPMTVNTNDELSMSAEEARIIHAVSPKVEMEEIAGGTKLTITDVDGDHETDIMDGADGSSAYVWIKWSAIQPTQDSDMKDTADAYIGIYSGDSSTAPTAYTSYTWYQYKGDTGASGTNAYVWIKYSEDEPTQDSDMKDTADAWMGIYSGSASTAPTAYTSYTWYQIKGDKGDTGDQGPTGAGVPVGGAAGQILMKNSATDFDTLWANAPTQSTMRTVPISIAVSDWTGSSAPYQAEFTSAYVTSTSVEMVYMDESVNTYAQNVSSLTCAKKTGGGGIIFTASAKPTGTISGNALVWDNDDGKVPVLIESTVLGIANGGTNASSLSGAQTNLQIGDPATLHTTDKTNLVSAVNENADNIVTLNGNLTSFKNSFNIPVYNSTAKTIAQFLSYMEQNNMRYLYLNGSSVISDWTSGLPVTSYIIAERLNVGAVSYLHMIGTVGNTPVAFVAFYINGITGISQL